MSAPHFGTRYQPIHFPKLLGLLPVRRSPNILRMRRAAPTQSAEESRIPRDRCRRVQKMRVEMPTALFELVDQNNRLAEMPQSVPERISLKIAPPGGRRLAEIRMFPLMQPSSRNPQWFTMQVFWQIPYRRSDFVVNRVLLLIRRMPQRDDADKNAAVLECRYFLRDKGFRKSRIALEHEDDRIRHPPALPAGFDEQQLAIHVWMEMPPREPTDILNAIHETRRHRGGWFWLMRQFLQCNHEILDPRGV
jgi:hypothetical protein